VGVPIGHEEGWLWIFRQREVVVNCCRADEPVRLLGKFGDAVFGRD
jgi:hypothetical protein